MFKKLTALILSGALIFSLGAVACAEGRPMNPTIASRPMNPTIAARPDDTMPDSVLYYGEVLEIVRNEKNDIIMLRMESPRDGAMTMNISARTFWIDASAAAASDPSTLEAGEHLYVYHSPITAFSMPPQSPAYAVVRNIPMDAGCPSYHEVESVAEKDGQLHITTDNGALTVTVAAESTAVTCSGEELPAAKADDYATMMVWYADSVNKETHTVPAARIMFLAKYVREPAQLLEDQVLTRGALAAKLHARAGSPAVDYLMNFSDVDASNDAIRWAASQQLMQGYGDGTFGPDDTLTYEQLITVLWRANRSPRLMDYPGLTQFTDADKISSYASFAMMWAHQQGLMAEKDSVLEPQAAVTAAQADALIAALAAK